MPQHPAHRLNRFQLWRLAHTEVGELKGAIAVGDEFKRRYKLMRNGPDRWRDDLWPGAEYVQVRAPTPTPTCHNATTTHTTARVVWAPGVCTRHLAPGHQGTCDVTVVVERVASTILAPWVVPSEGASFGPVLLLTPPPAPCSPRRSRTCSTSRSRCSPTTPRWTRGHATSSPRQRARHVGVTASCTWTRPRCARVGMRAHTWTGRS